MPEASLYSCPHCHTPIIEQNCNPETGMAICSNCEKSTHYSQLIRHTDDASILACPPRCLKIEKTTHGIMITYNRTTLIAMLMIFQLIVGNIFIFFFLGEAFFSRIASTLIAADIVIAIIIGCVFLKKSVITVSRGKGSFFSGIGKIGFTRHFALHENTSFVEQQNFIRHNRQAYQLIIINPGEKPLKMGNFLDEDIIPYLKAQFNQHKQ